MITLCLTFTVLLRIPFSIKKVAGINEYFKHVVNKTGNKSKASSILFITNHPAKSLLLNKLILLIIVVKMERKKSVAVFAAELQKARDSKMAKLVFLNIRKMIPDYLFCRMKTTHTMYTSAGWCRGRTYINVGIGGGVRRKSCYRPGEHLA